MTLPHVLTTLLLPALGGLTLGFLAGVTATLYWCGRRRERDELVPTYTDANNPTPGRTPWRGSEHLSRMGWVLAILGVIGLVAGVVGLVQNNSTAGCLREYIERTSIVNQQRATAGDIDRQGIRQQRSVTREFNQAVIDSLTHPVTDPAAMEKARQDFLVKARDWNARLDEVNRLDQAAEQQRRASPLPAEPNC